VLPPYPTDGVLAEAPGGFVKLAGIEGESADAGHKGD
jgi:hypothetical protein